MTYFAMGKIIEWILRPENNEVTAVERHLYPALFSIAWQLWLRSDEMKRLRFCDIVQYYYLTQS